MRPATLFPAILPALAAGGLFAAPVPPQAPLPPVTEEHLKASAGNLKEIGLAFHNYESTFGHFPGDIAGKDGKPLLSWRVAVLPYLQNDNQGELYKQFELGEPWDSEHNKKLVEKMPKLYAPVRARAPVGTTFYQGFTGPKALFGGKKPFRVVGIADGTSNTGMVFEAGDPVVWTKPADLPFDEKKPLPKLGGLFDGLCQVAMCDGSVIRVKKGADEGELKKLIMPADGNPIDVDALTK